MKVVIVFILTLGLSAVTTVTHSYIVMNRLPVEYAQLVSLRRGDPADVVVSTLGKPSQTDRHGDRLVYSNPNRWTIVYVYLKDGKFQAYEVDR